MKSSTELSCEFTFFNPLTISVLVNLALIQLNQKLNDIMIKFFKCTILFLSVLIFATPVYTQELPANAIDNVMIHLADGTVIDSGTIVWRDGVIEAAGAGIEIPFDAYIIDGGDSLHVYPGFIDGMTTWGSPDRGELESADNPGNPGYERAGIQPDRSPREVLETDDKNLADALKNGFTTAMLSLKGEMLPGRSDIFFLHGKKTESGLFEQDKGLVFQFEGARGGFSNRAYPNTTMGVMAKFRQLMYDAQALKDHIDYFAAAEGAIPAPERDKVLESLFPILDNQIPVYFVADSPEDLERFFTLQEEFGISAVVVSGKDLWHKADELADKNIPVLASVELPEMPEWYKKEKEDKDSDSEEEAEPDEETEDEELTEEEENFRERQLKSYIQTVKNISNLMKAGVSVGFSGYGLEPDKFEEHFKNLLDEGDLTKTDLIKILSINTAEILNIANKTGEIKPGNIASFSVMTEPFGEEKSEVIKAVSNGEIHEF